MNFYQKIHYRAFDSAPDQWQTRARNLDWRIVAGQ